jgi:hypothetical protein
MLTFKLLDGAHLELRERQLALTACTELQYNSMKAVLKCIFGEGNRMKEDNRGAVKVKEESAFFTQNRYSTYRGKQNRYQNFPKKNNDRKYGKDVAKGGNPLNKFGKPTKCSICSSIMHWWKDCPHKSEDVKYTEEQDDLENKEIADVEECNITLFTENIENVFHTETVEKVFSVETKNAAVIDTACTRTVCGDKWLNNFIESTKDDVRTVYSRKPFKFGDGNIVYSYSKATLPVTIAETKCNIETEVVKEDIPLLLSKTSLKKAGTKLDLSCDSAILFGKPVELQFTSSGHYCIELCDSDVIAQEKYGVEKVLLTVDENMNTDCQK